MDADSRSQDTIEIMLSLDVLTSKLDELKGSLGQDANTSMGAVLGQGLQAIDAKLTGLDAQVRQLISQRQQPPPKLLPVLWPAVATLVFVTILGVGVGWWCAPLLERGLIQSTIKATMIELGYKGKK